jgi:hypothetical protein
MGGKDSHKAKLPVRELMAFNHMDERQSHAPISDFDELTQQKARGG